MMMMMMIMMTLILIMMTMTMSSDIFRYDLITDQIAIGQ